MIKSRRKRKAIVNKSNNVKGKLYGVGVASDHLSRGGLAVNLDRLNFNQVKSLMKILKLSKKSPKTGIEQLGAESF